MIQYGMPTLIENRTLQENIDLCNRLGLRFIELNMNFPEYQVDRQSRDLLHHPSGREPEHRGLQPARHGRLSGNRAADH